MRKIGVMLGGQQPQGAAPLDASISTTAWGDASAPVLHQRMGDVDIYYLHRHGSEQDINPHQINSRANVAALHGLGVECLFGLYTVGSIDPNLPVGGIVMPDQIIDYTWGREHTFDDERRHIDFTEPFDQALGARLAEFGEVITGGVYACTQGPRLESAAEVKRLAQDGATLVGMTAMPEVALARELALPVVGLCLVVNPAAGVGGNLDAVDMEALYQVARTGGEQILTLLQRFFESL